MFTPLFSELESNLIPASQQYESVQPVLDWTGKNQCKDKGTNRERGKERKRERVEERKRRGGKEGKMPP